MLVFMIDMRGLVQQTLRDIIQHFQRAVQLFRAEMRAAGTASRSETLCSRALSRLVCAKAAQSGGHRDFPFNDRSHLYVLDTLVCA